MVAISVVSSLVCRPPDIYFTVDVSGAWVCGAYRHPHTLVLIKAADMLTYGDALVKEITYTSNSSPPCNTASGRYNQNTLIKQSLPLIEQSIM